MLSYENDLGWIGEMLKHISEYDEVKGAILADNFGCEDPMMHTQSSGDRALYAFPVRFNPHNSRSSLVTNSFGNRSCPASYIQYPSVGSDQARELHSHVIWIHRFALITGCGGPRLQKTCGIIVGVGTRRSNGLWIHE